MAIVEKPTDEMRVKLHRRVDYYKLRGLIWVMRKYPKKIKPPYTDLQAEAMAVFGIANTSMSRISEHILEAWRIGSVGKTASWTDTFRGIIMGYWKLYRVIAPIAIDYKVIETDTQFKVQWDILQVYLVPEIPEELYTLETLIINKEDILKAPKPIYFTIYLNGTTRFVAPYILFDIT